MNNFLSSNFVFSEDENLLKYKFKVFNSISIIIIFFSMLFAVLGDLKINDIGEIHPKVNYVYAFGVFLAVCYLRYSKEYYDRVTHIALTLSLFAFTSALIFVPQDEFRMIWFYLLVYVAYMLQSSKWGVFYTFLSIMSILLSNYFFDLKLTPVSINTGVLGLLIMSLLSRTYSMKITDYERDLLQKSESLQLLASTDSLTGIMNKRCFDEVSKKDFEAAQLTDNGITLMVLDIDYFKKVNDTYGHGTGDNILVAFTNSIKNVLRENDVFARIGGEEFAVLLFQTDVKEGLIIAQKICKEVEKVSVGFKNIQVGITTSIGISNLKSDDATFHTLFNRADGALYKAKEQGRNQVCSL